MEDITVAWVNGAGEISAASAEGVVRGYVLDPVALLEIARGRTSVASPSRSACVTPADM